MKNKIALFLAIMFSLGALALTACADKKPEPQRKLDSVEQKLVGEWTRDYDSDGPDAFYIFHNNGKWESKYESGEFYHDGEGVETDGKARGHFYIIKIVRKSGYFIEYAWLDDYPDNLYGYDRIHSMDDVEIRTELDNFDYYVRKSMSGPGNETKLDSVEKSMVGEWQHQDINSVYTFNNDGTYSVDGEKQGKFAHNGDGTDDLFGHYNVIEFNKWQWRVYDFANGVLYSGGSHQPFLIKNGSKRILHSCERTILGTWQDSTSKSRQYTFGSDGTLSCTSWHSTNEKYFYIRSEGTHNTKGHYYVFTFPNTGISDWYIFDNDRNNAYQNASGAIYATRI